MAPGEIVASIGRPGKRDRNAFLRLCAADVDSRKTRPGLRAVDSKRRDQGRPDEEGDGAQESGIGFRHHPDRSSDHGNHGFIARGTAV